MQRISPLLEKDKCLFLSCPWTRGYSSALKALPGKENFSDSSVGPVRKLT